MSVESVFTNARVVTADAVVHGAVLVRDGMIVDVSSTPTRAGDDLDGDTLLPGLVELHTDHLDSHFAPRPKVRWNPDAAVLAHDAQIAASGITTVFNATRVGLDGSDGFTGTEAQALAGAIRAARDGDRLRVDHLLHLRCEVSAPDCLTTFALFADDPLVRLVSLMDHAPGQRQFTSLDAYRTYYLGKGSIAPGAFEAHCTLRIAQSAAFSAPNRRHIGAFCKARGIILASHDDATAAHVAESAADGVAIAEFPTTLEAARASKAAGLVVLMGAPNLVRGGSHSGNVAAATLLREGHLDILSSDYIPSSGLQAAFRIAEGKIGIGLPAATRLITLNPAVAAGLSDRGAIAPGLRADLVRVRVSEGMPVVPTVWRLGRRVL